MSLVPDGWDRNQRNEVDHEGEDIYWIPEMDIREGFSTRKIVNADEMEKLTRMIVEKNPGGLVVSKDGLLRYKVYEVLLPDTPDDEERIVEASKKVDRDLMESRANSHIMHLDKNEMLLFSTAPFMAVEATFSTATGDKRGMLLLRVVESKENEFEENYFNARKVFLESLENHTQD